MEIDIVIGANFGDEGKGLITDFYASKAGPRTLVVRHNSSAQAGHTVTLQDGTRHVFGHIGAGSFAGASTYLSRFYICNPFLFAKEYQALEEICEVPDIYVDKKCLVTTPYDIMINQIVEEYRGPKRHGSCGVGFGETIERNLHPQFALNYADLDNLPQFLNKLMAIRHHWVPKRLVALGVHRLSHEWIKRIESDEVLEDYINKAGFMLRTLKKVDGLPTENFDRAVFEGAQGLMLDQDHRYFPHVTRSATGIRNAFAVIEEAGLKKARVTYVTRSYLTRHGAGPLPYELTQKPYPNIVDLTNIKNEYQGHLRFAWLDLDMLALTVRNDKLFVPATVQTEFGLAVTCMDQIEGPATFVENGTLQACPHDQFLQKLYQITESSFGLASYGPTRSDVRVEIYLTVP